MFPRLNVKKLFRVAWFIIMAVAFWYIQKVNYISTYDSLGLMFGYPDWVRFISIAVVLIDAGSISRAFTSEKGLKNEPELVQTLMYLWLGTSILDGFFNWYFAAREIVPGFEAPGLGSYAYTLVPIVVAVFIWGLQFGITYMAGIATENLFDDLGLFRGGGGGHNKAMPQNQQVSYPKPKPSPEFFRKP